MDLKEKPKACGAIIVDAQKQKCLMGLRGKGGDHSNEWAWFGGKVDNDESDIECIKREVMEETGYTGPMMEFVKLHVNEHPNYTYTTYMAVVPQMFEPELNDEHETHCWCHIGDFPEPMHPGVIETLKYLDK